MQRNEVACASCGAVLSVPDDVRRLTCAHCGSALVVERGHGFVATRLAPRAAAPAQPAVDAVPSGQAPTCPNCGRPDAVRKVTAILRAGTTGTSADPSGGATTPGLAQKLRFPLQRPSAPPPWAPAAHKDAPRRSLGFEALVLALGAILAVLVLAGVIGFSGTSGAGNDRVLAALVVIGLAIFLAAFPGFVRLLLDGDKPAQAPERPPRQHRDRNGYKAALQLYRSEWNAYELALQRQESMCYCSRCDTVFVPGEGRGARPEDLLHLLKGEPCPGAGANTALQIERARLLALLESINIGRLV